MQKNGIFYGWYVVASCFILELICYGLAIGTSSLYVKPICDDLGLSRGEFSIVFSIMSIVNMIVCITFGMVHKKIGVRIIFLIGVICEASAFAMYYLASNIYLFYAGAVFMGVGTMYLGAIPLSLVISNWFIEKRGTILGIIFSGSGIGGAILNPLVGYWIDNYGWRTAYFISMVIVLLFSVLALLLIREKPSDVGLTAFGETMDFSNSGNKDINDVSGLTWKEAIKTSYLWFTLLAALLFGMSIQPVFLSAPAYLSDVGLTSKSIAEAMSVIYVLNLLGKVFLGFVNDKFGIRPVILISHLSFLVSVLFLIFTNNSIIGFTFAVFFGVAAVALNIPIPLLTGILFGQKDFGTLMGIIMAAYTTGVAIGTPLNGLSFDIFHTYTPAFVLQIVLDIASIFLMMAALNKRLKKKDNVIINTNKVLLND